MTQPRVIVTGAAGFVGRHVINACIEAGLDVVAVVRSQGKAAALPGGIEVVTADIAEHPLGMDDLGHPEALIHLAWGGLSNYASRHHFEEELLYHYRFVRRLVAQGLSAVTVAGTCLEYGLREGELDEEMPADPVVAYATAKDTLRRQLTHLKVDLGFRLTWARLFYLYGPGQTPTSLWSSLQQAIQRGDERFSMSGGEQLRDFLPVQEAAHHLVKLSLLDADTGTVNVCSGRPTSVRRLVELWIDEAGARLELELGAFDYPPYEPLAFWGSPTRLRSLTSSNIAASPKTDDDGTSAP